MIEYKNRIANLKVFEVLCYSLCIHILVEEALAINATKAVLLDLFKDEQFWLLEGKERDKRARRLAIARSMEVLTKRVS